MKGSWGGQAAWCAAGLEAVPRRGGGAGTGQDFVGCAVLGGFAEAGERGEGSDRDRCCVGAVTEATRACLAVSWLQLRCAGLRGHRGSAAPEGKRSAINAVPEGRARPCHCRGAAAGRS